MKPTGFAGIDRQADSRELNAHLNGRGSCALRRALYVLGILAFIPVLVWGQLGVWCKTITAGPNFREIMGWEEDDFLSALRVDFRDMEFGILRVFMYSAWISAELNDRGHLGDPMESDSIYWHWEKHHFGGVRLITYYTIGVLTTDSTVLTSESPGFIYPDFRETPSGLYPNNDTLSMENDIHFVWESVDDIDYYNFYLWEKKPDEEDYSDGLVLSEEELELNEYMIESRWIDFSGEYYWMVIAYDRTPWLGGGLELARFELEPQSVEPTDQDQIISDEALIYPNPAQSGLPIFINPLGTIIKTINITDVSGRTLMNFGLSQASGQSNIWRLDSKDLGSGTYFVNLFYSSPDRIEKHHTSRLIIIR